MFNEYSPEQMRNVEFRIQVHFEVTFNCRASVENLSSSKSPKPVTRCTQWRCVLFFVQHDQIASSFRWLSALNFSMKQRGTLGSQLMCFRLFSVILFLGCINKGSQSAPCDQSSGHSRSFFYVQAGRSGRQGAFQREEKKERERRIK